jgi:hypothetical protein
MNIPRYKPVANDKFGIADDADGKLCEYRDYARLEAEVERLTKQVERLIVSLQKSHDEHGEALYKLKYKNERQTPRKKRSS